jgi:hypothetical protein
MPMLRPILALVVSASFAVATGFAATTAQTLPTK